MKNKFNEDKYSDTENSKELITGIISAFILFLLVILLLFSCQTPKELAVQKENKAKQKLDKILNQYPSLLNKVTSTIVKNDTIVNNRIIHVNDSIYLPGSVRLDTLVQLKNDSILIEHNNLLIELVRLSRADKSGEVYKTKIIEQPHYIYYRDTIHLIDTTFIKEVNTQTDITIDTKQSFWWSLWFQVKGWLWFILIIVVILVILRIIFKFLG